MLYGRCGAGALRTCGARAQATLPLVASADVSTRGASTTDPDDDSPGVVASTVEGSEPSVVDGASVVRCDVVRSVVVGSGRSVEDSSGAVDCSDAVAPSSVERLEPVPRDPLWGVAVPDAGVWLLAVVDVADRAASVGGTGRLHQGVLVAHLASFPGWSHHGTTSRDHPCPVTGCEVQLGARSTPNG